MKTAIFIDRDGTILYEPEDEQIDSYEKFRFLEGVISNLSFLRSHTSHELVMVSNQDGLGTDAYPESDFLPTHNLMLQTLKGEGVEFDEILIDRSFPEEHLPTRKPGTGMLTKYLGGDYDLINCFVVGDRVTDAMLALNLGCKALILQPQADEAKVVLETELAKLKEKYTFDNQILMVSSWDQVAEVIYAGHRTASVRRTTKETDVDVRLDLDGQGKCDISTGLGFFDHMLEQIAKHGNVGLYIHVKGDLEVDEHHTIEDTGIALGECFLKALGDKRGIERYGYCLPMDDCLCQVAIDFGGRAWLVWDAEFHREKVGDMPTEMFLHFFKSFSDAARMNLNIKAEGENEHHKIEGIFKALARAIKMAVKRDVHNFQLPSSKGVL